MFLSNQASQKSLAVLSRRVPHGSEVIVFSDPYDVINFTHSTVRLASLGLVSNVTAVALRGRTIS